MGLEGEILYQRKREDLLLDCFILFEKGNYDNIKTALTMFMGFTGIKGPHIALNELKSIYNHFLKTGEI